MNMIHLGDRQFTCKKGQLRLHGDSGTTRYPPGKREKVTVATKVGILSYTCNYVRSIVSCPVNTSAVTVKRGPYTGRYDVECLGDPQTGAPGADVDQASDDGPAGEGGTGAGSSGTGAMP